MTEPATRKFQRLPGMTTWQSLRWEWRRLKATRAAGKLVDLLDDCSADNELMMALHHWFGAGESDFLPRRAAHK